MDGSFAVRWLVCALFTIGLTHGVIAAPRQEPAPSPTSTGQATTPSPVVKRTILPDGTVQFDYADGKTRREPLANLRGPDSAPSQSGGLSPNGLEPIAPPDWLKDPATNQAFLRAMGEYYAYRASGLLHRRRVFEWQLVSSKIIFIAVLLLVASGIVFAALQFRAGLRRTTSGARDEVTSLDISTTSVKVSSPILGVIILVISLAFFYLYLVYVYPITELV